MKQTDTFLHYSATDGFSYVVYVVRSPLYASDHSADYCSLSVWLVPGQEP